MITNKKVSIQILLKNDVELKYYQFRYTVKINYHSLYTQIILKKFLNLFQYKKQKYQAYQQKKEKQDVYIWEKCMNLKKKEN